MDQILKGFLTALNDVGAGFWDYASSTFIQSSLLIALLYLIDLLVRNYSRAIFRYTIWMLVFIKLVLPPSLCLPTGIGYWCGELLSSRQLLPRTALEPNPDVSARPVAPEGLPTQDLSLGPSFRSPLPAGTPNAATPTVSRFEPVTWQAIIFVLWLIGVVVLSVLLIQRWFFVRGLIAQSNSAAGQLVDMLNQCRRKICIHRDVRLRLSSNTSSPAVCGFLNPVILIPTSLVEKLSPDNLKAVLIHELAHIKRGDLWINFTQNLLQIIYFYNPFVWLANAVVRRIREQAVDEMVLVALGEEARTYSDTLIDIAELAFRKPSFTLRLVGVVESKRALQRRIKHMLTRPIPKSARIGALGTIVIFVVAAILLPMARAEKSNKDAPATPAVTGAGATEQAPLAGEGDTIVDPNTGLKFTVAKKISGENDVIVDDYTLRLSPNGKFLLYQGQVVPLDGSKAFKLEALHGTEDAAWSYDGKLIAYRDKLAIWLLPVSPETGQPTGPARKLLDGQINLSELEILWSRDSEWIIVSGYYVDSYPYTTSYQHTTVSVQDGRLMQPPDYTRFSLPSPDQKSLAYLKPHNGVWTVPVKGGASRLVFGEVEWTKPQSVTVPLWWSPDGEWLLCGLSKMGWNYIILHFVRLADRREVRLNFPEELGSRALGLTPDGKKLQIYKTSYDSRSAFKVAPIRGGGPAELASSRLVDIDPRSSLSSPDGQRWFFIGYNKGGGDAAPYVAASAAADPVEMRLPEEVKREGAINYGAARRRWLDAAWRWLVSPDGKRLIRCDSYGDKRGGRFSDLYVIPISLEKAESTGPATLIFKEEWPYSSIFDKVWSPDSSRLAIPGSRKGAGLWVVPADGSPPKQLAQSPDEEAWDLKWSPDGKFIAYSVQSPGQISLYTVSAEGGAPKRLWTKSGSNSLRYTWFPDSREIGLVSDDALVAVAIADGSVRPFLKLAEAGFTRLQWFRWSPDGQILGLYGAKDDRPGPIALFHASDKRIEILPDPDPGEKGRPGWTGDSQAIFYRYTSPFEKVRPAALIYEVDIGEAWTQAKNSVTGESSPASASHTAKLEAPPLVNGEFRDDFEDGDTKYWTFQDESEGGFDHVREVQNGELVLENTRAIIGLPEWTNYVVTVKMCIKRGGGTLTFRSWEYGEYCLSAQPDKLWFGIRYRSTHYHPGMLAESPYNFVLDKWYTIQVEVKGPHIVVRVDGQDVIDLSDENCPQGAVALISGLGARVHFDDFSVRQLP